MIIQPTVGDGRVRFLGQVLLPHEAEDLAVELLAAAAQARQQRSHEAA
jgi:hypothetical protein